MNLRLPLTCEWIGVVANLPQNATYHKSSAETVDADSVAFLEVATPVDDISKIRLVHGRISVPSAQAPTALGACHILFQSGPVPGMVLGFTGTGNQILQVTVRSERLGTLPAIEFTCLFSNFDWVTGAHMCQASVDLESLLPAVSNETNTQRLMLSAKLRGHEPMTPKAGLLSWLRSQEGDCARRALPSIGAALRHNQEAAQLDSHSWIAEIETTLQQATRRFLEDPSGDLTEVTQLEQLYAYMLAIRHASTTARHGGVQP